MMLMRLGHAMAHKGLFYWAGDVIVVVAKDVRVLFYNLTETIHMPSGDSLTTWQSLIGGET